MRIFPQVLDGKQVTWPGDLEAEREFVYVEDAAEAMVKLAESQVSWGEAWHVPGSRTTTAREFITMAFKAAGTEPGIRSVGKTGQRLSRSKDDREEVELFYLFQRPPILDGEKWNRTYGPHPATDYKVGIGRTMDWWKRQ